MKESGIDVKVILADAGFSSVENYALLEQMKLEAFIPLHGTYESHREDFKYDGRRNAFICPQGQILKASYTKFDHGRKQVAYTSSKKICDQCPQRMGCVNRRGIKRIMSTMYKREYERMIKRLKTKRGKESYALRMQTVEPVFGSLQQYSGLRRMNVRGKLSATKVMLLSAAAFNLKKWVKMLIKDTQNFILTKIATIRRSIKYEIRKIHEKKKYRKRYTDIYYAEYQTFELV